MDAQTSRLRRQTGLHGFEMTDDLLRTARHAYLGSVSYLDDNVGRLLEVLRQCDLDSNTTVVFTTDHGDMLGEHGLWYKKTFFEYSARIPLIVSSPQSYPSRRVASNVSLVDLLPTLMELASGGTAPETIEPIDGRSLCALMRGDDSSWDNVVLSEMLAESAVAPLVMLRRDNYKYIYSAPDPEQLFDLQTDPLETRNLAAEPRHESVRAGMAAEVKSCWDLETLTEQVLASQRRRLFLREVLAKGKRPDWDFHPDDEASKHCLRGGGVYNEWCYTDIIPLRSELLGKYPNTQ